MDRRPAGLLQRRAGLPPRAGRRVRREVPKVAARLLLEADKCEDPHVERLLEGFAFLAARVRHKIDDEFPEITDVAAERPLPALPAPLPSLSIVQFLLDPEQVEADDRLTGSSGGRGSTRGRWPGSPAGSGRLPGDALADRGRGGPARPGPRRLPGQAARRPSPSCSSACAAPAGLTFAQLELDRLRFYLDGEGPLAFGLYELLLNNACRLLVRGRAARRPGRDRRARRPRPSSRSASGATRGCSRTRAARSSATACSRSTSPSPRSSSSSTSTGLECLPAAGFGDAVELLFFLDRAAAAGPAGRPGELPARLHADRQPVPAGRPSRSR